MEQSVKAVCHCGAVELRVTLSDGLIQLAAAIAAFAAAEEPQLSQRLWMGLR